MHSVWSAAGKFNYHLSKLVDHFVDHDGEGYELRYAGHRAIDAIQSGVFHGTPALDRFVIDSQCRSCGGSHVFEYADHMATVTCLDCGETAIEYPFDPGGLGGQSREEVVQAFSQ